MPEPSPTRVLVVDDQHDIANVFERLLTRLGYEPHVCRSGDEALARLCEIRPRIALLDLSMPLMDGYEVARQIRARADIDQPVLIAVTGLGSAEDRRRTTEAGFDASYLSAQLDAHKDAVAVFRDYAANGPTPPLKAFAEKTLPTLEHHLTMVEELHSKHSK